MAFNNARVQDRCSFFPIRGPLAITVTSSGSKAKKRSLADQFSQRLHRGIQQVLGSTTEIKQPL